MEQIDLSNACMSIREIHQKTCYYISELIKERESHILILLFLNLLLSSWSITSSSSSSSTGNGNSSSSWDRGELLTSLSNDFLNVLSLELLEEKGGGIGISVNTNCMIIVVVEYEYVF